MPACRASKQMIEQLDNLEIKYKSVNILFNQKLKEWLKYFANWPQFPQLYIYGKFIGGTEIMLQLIENDDFMAMIPQECIRTNAIERINKAWSLSVVVIFIKGTKKRPFDGYQREAIKILDESRVRYSAYNVMNDPDLREILKEISRKQSYPQLFVNRKFVGGLSFLKDAHEKGGLASKIPSTEVMLPMREKIQKLINTGRIMLFIEGTIDFPTDVRSEQLVNIVRDPMYEYSKDDLHSFDLCQDSEIQPALLEYCCFK